MSNVYVHFLLLSLSLLGWGMFSHHRLNITPAFIPIFVFSSITCFVFGAGLLNFMPHIVNLIFYFGIVLFAIYIYLIFKKRYDVKSLFVPSLLFFVLLSFYMTLLLKGVILIHYDNFSHWGLIVKEMFRINGLPDGTTIVSFRNYLPGSAVFIYFIGKIIGPDESHMLMAQSYLIAACLSVLFVFSKWKRPTVILLNIVISVILLVVIPNNHLDLLVDTLLGVLALSITVIAYYYRDNWLKSIILNAPLLVFLLLVKDSGKIFIFINIALIMWFIYANNVKGSKNLFKDGKKLIFALVFLLFVPLFTNFLWVQYIEKAYPNFQYEDNKFALSEDIFSSINKSDGFVATFTPKFIEASIDPDPLFTLNGLALLFMLVLFLKTKKVSKQLVYPMLFTNFVYILYVVFCYIMYLFMMPESEAIVLGGYYRYISTIIIYFAGIMMLSILHEFEKYLSVNKSGLIQVISLVLIASIFIYPFDNFNTLYTKPEFETSVRQNVINENAKVKGSAGLSGIATPRVIYYSPKSESDYGYLPYVLSYEHLSWSSFVVVNHGSTKEEQDKLLTLMNEMDYLVVLDSDIDFNNYLLDKFDVEEPIGAFRINKRDSEIEMIPLQ